MLRPTAVKIEILSDYRIQLLFDSGESRIFNVKPYMSGGWYSELRDGSYFSRARINGFSVEWPNGQDICPDDLYYKSIPVSNTVKVS